MGKEKEKKTPAPAPEELPADWTPEDKKLYQALITAGDDKGDALVIVEMTKAKRHKVLEDRRRMEAASSHFKPAIKEQVLKLIGERKLVKGDVFTIEIEEEDFTLRYKSRVGKGAGRRQTILTIDGKSTSYGSAIDAARALYEHAKENELLTAEELGKMKGNIDEPSGIAWTRDLPKWAEKARIDVSFE